MGLERLPSGQNLANLILAAEKAQEVHGEANWTLHRFHEETLARSPTREFPLQKLNFKPKLDK